MDGIRRKYGASKIRSHMNVLEREAAHWADSRENVLGCIVTAVSH